MFTAFLSPLVTGFFAAQASNTAVGGRHLGWGSSICCTLGPEHKSLSDADEPPSSNASIPHGAVQLDRNGTEQSQIQRRPQSLEELISKLNFGYERQRPPAEGNRLSGRQLSVASLIRNGSGSTRVQVPKSSSKNAAVTCDNCPVRYLCERGHVVTAFKDSPACLGCPLCRFEQATIGGNNSRRRLSLKSLQEIANDRNGVCLASHYESARVPVPWRCHLGHVWLASVDNVKGKGSWCPECARLKKKLSMSDMHQMAALRGGKCLSSEYISGLRKLRWQCANGHEFLLAPNNIRRAPNGSRKPSWCPVCRSKLDNGGSLCIPRLGHVRVDS